MTLHLEHPAPGIAVVGFGPSGRRLTYRTDADAHCVTVHDDFGRLHLAFGGRSGGPAALHTPLDITCVHPTFPGEHLALGGPEALWLAVADYGHRRIQVFELDGAHVGSIPVGDRPGLGAPCRLAWRNPVLVIEGLEGAHASVYLSAALLLESAQTRTAPRLPREWRASSHLVN